MLKIKKHNLFSIPTLTILILTLTMASIPHSTEGAFTITSPDPTLAITMRTDKETYLLRQKITIEGEITQDGTPATDLVVIIQIENPTGTKTAYRTLTIGNPTQTWPLNITNLFLLDLSNNPINTAKIGTQIQACITIHNWQMTARPYFATITIFDANMVPLRTSYWSGSLDPQQTTTLKSTIYIEKWACTGKALVVGNVYSKEPKEGGIALSKEKTAYFCISKTQTALLDYPELPPPPPQTTPGYYATHIRASPEPTAGEYKIYARAQSSPTSLSSTTTTFNIQNSQGYPPQASFAYWPATPYENQTVQFDASSSTPEGFNDTITSYTWYFGDDTPPITETDPYITHNYLNTGTYTITLNVTDNEGLWSTTSKPITIYPEFGPTANFTWTPPIGVVNKTVTFNASSTELGWSKELSSFAPIKNYIWNFSDGTEIANETTPTITHNFTQPGNYSVTLTVIDMVNRNNSITKTVQILNVTENPWDVNGDGKVDMIDLWLVAKAFGSTPGSPTWDPRCDVDKDNDVDMVDLWLVAKHYGEEY